MPSPKNRIKATGDTHPPEVEYDLSRFDDADLRLDEKDEPQYRPPVVFAQPAPARVQSLPLMPIGLGLLGLYLVAKLLRR